MDSAVGQADLGRGGDGDVEDDPVLLIFPSGADQARPGSVAALGVLQPWVGHRSDQDL